MDGTFNANGTTQGNLGALTLTANSTISLGAAGTMLQFGDSGSGTGIVWTSGATLTILGWVSSDTVANGHGGDVALTSSQVARIDFDVGGTFYHANYSGGALTPGSVIPTPEAPVIQCVILLVPLTTAKEVRSRARQTGVSPACAASSCVASELLL